MKVHSITKKISVIISLVLLFQYISIIFPIFDVNAETESIINTLQAAGNESEISITKDESMLNVNKVYFNVEVPENTYTTILPDGNSSIDSNLTYEVTQNGQYVFEFVDIQGNSKVRVVHVNTIQNRKETKVPKVTAVNGQIKLESDCKIEYSLDSKNWEDYEQEINYKEPIFARVVSEDYECSIIKITLKQNGELNVQNTELRELYGEILDNINNEKIYKVSNVNTENNESSSLNIEYSLLYKEYVNVDYAKSTEKNEIKKLENGEIYDYKQIKLDSEGEEKDFWQETHVKYAYIDSEGNLNSNIELINNAKEKIEKFDKNIKYEKIVGDGERFFILSDKAEIYFAGRKSDEININFLEDSEVSPIDEGVNYLVAKLNTENVLNIYDSYTALTKDGEIISLIQRSEEELNDIKKLENETDKYLNKSHVCLKNGKLYNFENVEEQVEIAYGKLAKSDETGVGIYSESKNTIKLFDTDSNNDVIKLKLEEDESYINVEGDNKDLPEFIDIAECDELPLFEVSFLIEDEQVSCEDIGKQIKCYAITKDGKIWAYIDGYMVDTGVNISYFSPTANYTLDNTSWTNKNVKLDVIENTQSKIVSKELKKDDELISKEDSYEIETNGEYVVTITDTEKRSYDFTINIENIDKLSPDLSYRGKIENGIATIVAYDKEDITGNFAKSGIDRIELTYEFPAEDTEWTTLEGKIDEKGKLIAIVKQIATTKLAYIRAIDNAGNISQIRKIDFKEELNEEEQKKQIEEQKGVEINKSNAEIEEKGFNNNNFLESNEENNAEVLYMIIGVVIIASIGISIYIKNNK